MRVDERTEISMTRHHLQSGVSGVERGRLPSEVEPHAKYGRDEATADTSESDGLGRFVGRGENGARRPHPQDPPCRPAPPTPLPDAKLQASRKPQTNSSSCWGAPGVTSGPVSFMNTLISLRM